MQQPTRPTIPIGLFDSFRYGATRLPRGNLIRKACVRILKSAAPGYRLADAVSEIRPLDDTTLSFQPCDSMVMDDVYWFGLQGYEGILIDLWAGLAQRSNSVLEIGGNVGLFTVVGGRCRGGAYTVVEPLPQNVAVLTANLARNAVTGVEVIAGAVIPDAEPHRVRLNVPDEGRDTPVGAHLIGSDIAMRDTKDVIETDGLPMAALTEGRDLIKIDAEGMETDLLQAAAEQIRRQRPSLVIEVLPNNDRLAAHLARIAADVGYDIWVVPAWSETRPVKVAAAELTARTPGEHHSKDVILTRLPLDELPHPFSR